VFAAEISALRVSRQVSWIQLSRGIHYGALRAHKYTRKLDLGGGGGGVLCEHREYRASGSQQFFDSSLALGFPY